MNTRSYILVGAVFLILVVGFLVGQAVRASASVDPAWAKTAKENLFVKVDAETKDSLLDDWRWKIGDKATVFRVTLFGDVFTQAPDGSISLLDTGTGQYVQVAKSSEKWAEILESRGAEWFHWKTLQELRSLGVELEEGNVFDWQHSPMLGGTETVDNIQWVSAWVKVSAAGQLARAIEEKKAGQQEPQEEEEDRGLYNVVINEELQYSLWPVGREFPKGWKSAGKTGTKQECMEYIKEVWTDMRPLSMRKKLDKDEQKP